MLGLACALLSTPALAANDADALRSRYQALQTQLQHNQFGRQLVLDSVETPNRLKGDIYAVLDHPYASVSAALNSPSAGPANWCDVMILHLNTKYCRAEKAGKGDRLNVEIGKKVEQALGDAYRVQFNYRSSTSSDDYFQVDLGADSGPLGTSDYRIAVEAVALDDRRTFLHLTYSYSYGMAGRMAMKTYLATIGSGKVGFTVTNPGAASPQYIGGVRGVVERNTMRYYLAIDAYLDALDARPEQQLQQRLNAWFDATEQYARQLHEVERDDYLAMKHKEYRRQQAP